jgi:hypothetical protein
MTNTKILDVPVTTEVATLTVKAVTRFHRSPTRDLPIGIMLTHEATGQTLDLKMSVEEAIRIANDLLQHCREQA